MHTLFVGYTYRGMLFSPLGLFNLVQRNVTCRTCQLLPEIIIYKTTISNGNKQLDNESSLNVSIFTSKYIHIV